MAETVTVKLELDASQSIKSISTLEQELEQMKTDLKQLDVGSDAFNRLKDKVVQADSRMKNLKQ